GGAENLVGSLCHNLCRIGYFSTKSSTKFATKMQNPHPCPTSVELRSADFSPPPLGTCKSAGSGMNSALQVRRNWLNSTAAHPCPLPWGTAAQGGYSRRRVVHPSVSSVSALAQFLPEHRRGHNESDRGDDLADTVLRDALRVVGAQEITGEGTRS